MANKLLLKKSSVANKVPLDTDLDYGELALNYTDGKLYYKKSDNTIASIGSREASTTTTATTQVVLITFAAANYGSGQVLLQATQGTQRHLTQLLVVQDGTVAYATEYGSIYSGTKLYSVDVDILSGNVRVLITPTSAISTVFKASYSLIGV